MRQDGSTFSGIKYRKEEFSNCFSSIFGKKMCIPRPSLVTKVHNRQHLLGMTYKLSVLKIHSLVDLGASDMPQKTRKLCSCDSIVKYLT